MVDLMGKKYYFFAFSLLLIVIGVFKYFTQGFVLDIQFQGGTIMNFQMEDGNFDTAQAERILSAAFPAKKISVLKTSTNLTSNKITDIATSKNVLYFLSVNVSSKDALIVAEQNKVKEIVNKEFKVKKGTQPETSHIMPSIGEELKNNAKWAVIVSSILIILYIWMRFNVMSGLSAGVSAILGLFHDIAIMVTVYLVFRIPLNESFIAAVLTIMGYSMNDTIIIYDRIRENSNLLRKIPIAELVNRSVIQTLARSINTVVTVLIAITTVYVFASINNIQSIKEFSFPLIIGIASGCYSSIFIAAPIWVLWKEYVQKNALKSKVSI
jgi:preprotein translocase subunit SecF